MENGNGKGLANVDISARIKQFVILNLIVLFGILISILL